MKVALTDAAQLRLQEIESHIARDNPRAALRTVDRILAVAMLLSDHPRIGRDWDGRTRALVVSGLPYRIHYRIVPKAGMVEILTVAHTSQRPPRFRRE